MVTAVSLLGFAVSAQALSFTESLTLFNAAKYEVEVDSEGTLTTKFEFGAVADFDSLSLPANWLIDVELTDGVYESSVVYGIDSLETVDATDKDASKLVEKTIKKDAGYIERQFSLFVLAGSHDPLGLIQFYGVLPDMAVKDGIEQYTGPIYIYGSFMDGEAESVIDFQGYISNLDPGPPSSAPVPEPATMLLMGVGMLGLAAVRRKPK
jgi:hypothetical protein